MSGSVVPAKIEASSKMPLLRRIWDYLPRFLRRPIIRMMRYPGIRLRVLSVLRVRPGSGFTTLSRGLGAIDRAMEKARSSGVVGDYYEFGLYRGYSFWYAQKVADQVGLKDMRFFGFDSFAGLPEVQGKDQEEGIFVPGDYLCTRADVERELTAHGFDWSRGTLVEGFFDQSLHPEIQAKLGMSPAAVILIDCDLYQSTVPVLNFVSNLLQDGTVVLFDDWYCFGGSSDAGEVRAFNEFLDARPQWLAAEFMDFPEYGKAFVLHRGDASDAPSRRLV